MAVVSKAVETAIRTGPETAVMVGGADLGWELLGRRWWLVDR